MCSELSHLLFARYALKSIPYQRRAYQCVPGIQWALVTRKTNQDSGHPPFGIRCSLALPGPPVLCPGHARLPPKQSVQPCTHLYKPVKRCVVLVPYGENHLPVHFYSQKQTTEKKEGHFFLPPLFGCTGCTG